MKLSGKVAVVTGASSGMGKAIVEKFVKEGANVVAVARREERLKELAESLAGQPGKVAIFAGDVSQLETNEDMIDFALKTFSSFDILVNNAGVMDDFAPVGEATDERFNQVMAVNVYGPFAAMRKAVNVFKANGTKGNIINIASIGAFSTAAGAIYCASKAALVSMTKNTAYMYMPDGIRCNAIAPGGVETEISTSIGIPNPAGYERIKLKFAAFPDHQGKAEDIANAALFLANEEDAAFINGAVLTIDGGATAS